jgi:putative intracellular protease/amidase
MKTRYSTIFTVILTITLFLPNAIGCSNSQDVFSATEKQRVLLIPRDENSSDFMITEELGVMRSMLEDAGFKVDVATITGETYEGAEIVIDADASLSDVDITDYVGIIMPCMARGLPGNVYPEAVQLVEEAVANGIPVAAQFGAVVTLWKAGVLEDVRFAGPQMIANSIGEENFVGFGVVQDGNIITSGTCPHMAKSTGRPDGTQELTQKLIDTINASSY